MPAFSKIYERLVYCQLVHYLEENNLLDDQQHGFRKGRSTITAGISFIQKIIEALDKQEFVVGVFLDLTKAFDSVLHERLLEVLLSLGVKGKELNWFRSYLSNRHQYVELEYTDSQKIQITALTPLEVKFSTGYLRGLF